MGEVVFICVCMGCMGVRGYGGLTKIETRFSPETGAFKTEP